MYAMEFGGFSEGGGRVLGLSVGGGKGIGCKLPRGCRTTGSLAGGEFGMKVDGENVEGNPTEERVSNASGNVGIESNCGDVGGDGVVDVDKKVGPRGVDDVAVDLAEAGEERKRSSCVRSTG